MKAAWTDTFDDTGFPFVSDCEGFGAETKATTTSTKPGNGDGGGGAGCYHITVTSGD